MKKLVAMAGAAVLALSAAAPVLAQTAAPQGAAGYPSRPVKLVVPFTAGGPTDIFGRMLAERLSQRWGQPVVIDNRPGSGTVIGTNAVATAPADGYTLGMVISAHVINPGLRGAQLPYDTLKDFAGVSLIGFDPIAVFAHPSFPANDPAGLIALVKSKPDAFAYATSGQGTALHLGAELLQQEGGLQMRHIPYNGTAQAVKDVVGGEVPLIVSVYSSVKPLVESGKVKIIGFLSPQRLPSLPNVPVFAEVLPRVNVISASGMIARAGTPQAVVEKVSRDIADIMNSEEMKPRLAQIAMTPVGSTPQAYDSYIRTEVEKWRAIITQRKITPE